MSQIDPCVLLFEEIPEAVDDQAQVFAHRPKGSKLSSMGGGSRSSIALFIGGLVLLVCGLGLLWRHTGHTTWLIGIPNPPGTRDCYTLALDYPARVALREQYVVTGTVTPVGWGVRERPNVTLQLSAAGMEVDPKNMLDVSLPSPEAKTSTVRWSVRPLAKGRFHMVVNTSSMSHPLRFIGTDGILTVDVYEPWTTIVSPYTGALLTFLGSLATLPGIVQFIQQYRQKKATQARIIMDS